MRARCNLRARRGDRSLSDIAKVTGLAKGELSMIERGHMLPLDAWLPRLQAAYGGTPEDWYPAGFLAAAHPDIRKCPGCDTELPPDSSRRRYHHDAACRRRAAMLMREDGEGRPAGTPPPPGDTPARGGVAQ